MVGKKDSLSVSLAGNKYLDSLAFSLPQLYILNSAE